MTSLKTNQSPIDAVIAWVDGSDPKHTIKKNRLLKSMNKKNSENHDSSRFSSNYEINYCVLSILKYAPFIRNIFIVTDNQEPPIFEDVKNFDSQSLDKIKIIDHKILFQGFEQYLPTFNSRSIATSIYRIPDLADRFIYFNDDFFLIKPCDVSDFFRQDRPVLRGSWGMNSNYRKTWHNLREKTYKLFDIDKEPRTSFNLSQWTAAKKVGYKLKYWKNYHTPHPINKDIVEKYFKENPSIFEENIKYQFRNVNQFSSISLYNHLEKKIYNNNFEEDSKEVYIKKREESGYIKKKLNYLQSNDCSEKFLCIQNFDGLTTKERVLLYTYLDSLIAKVNRDE